MTAQEIKQAFLGLPPDQQKDVARWVQKQVGGGSSTLLLPILLTIVALGILGGGGWSLMNYLDEQAKAQAAETEAERIEREAKKPRSPLNMDFLKGNIGNEITIRGIPRDFDVGFLFFSKQRKKGLRLRLFDGHIVVLQSTELEKLVRDGNEIQVTGTVEVDPEDGGLQMNVLSLQQMKIYKKEEKKTP